MIPYLILLSLVVFGIVGGDIESRINKRRCYYLLSFFILFFTCFHYRLGCDALEMEDEYPDIPLLTQLSFRNLFDLGAEPLFVLFCSFLKTVFCKDYLLFQIFHGLFVNIVILRFFWKETKYPFIALLIYFTFAFYYFNFEIIRQSIVIAIFLLIEKCIDQKRFIKYFFWVIVSIGFHYSSAFLLIVPFLKRLRLNKKTICMLFICVAALFFIGQKIMQMPEINILLNGNISSKITVYTDESRSAGEAGLINPYMLLVKVLMPLVLIWIGRKHIKENYQPYLFLYLLFSISNIASIPILGRIGDYFIPFYIIMLANFVYYLANVRRQPLVSAIRVFFFVLVFTFNFYSWFMLKSYNPKYRNVVKIYPYSSVFFPDKSQARENSGWKYFY